MVCGLFRSRLSQLSEDLYTAISVPETTSATFTERLKFHQLAIKLVVLDQASMVLYIVAKIEIP
jgi:hypothetical protein